MKELSQKYLIALTNKGVRNAIFKKEIIKELVSGDNPIYPKIIEKGTQISVIKNERGFEFIASILGLMINDFCGNFNTRNPMNDEQIADLAIELVTDYWSYKLEDFIAFFSLAKRGLYGKVYDRVDAATIYQMLAEYNKQRDMGLFEMQKYTDHEKYGREKQEDETGHVMALAGEFGNLRKLMAKNQEEIDRLNPDKKP